MFLTPHLRRCVRACGVIALAPVLYIFSIRLARNEHTVPRAKVTEIVTFSDFNYAPLASQWYLGLHALGYREQVILATDEKAYHIFRNKGYNVEIVPADRGRLWETRLEVLKRRIESGSNVLVSDVDILFKRFIPLSYFERTGAHVIFSQGTTWPPGVFRAQGFVVCMGLSWWSGTKVANDFLSRVLAICKNRTRCDDQETVNNLILNDHVIWYPSNEMHISKFGFSNLSGILINLLNTDFVWRDKTGATPCPDPQKIWAVHPLAAKVPQEKIKTIELWKEKCGTVEST